MNFKVFYQILQLMNIYRIEISLLLIVTELRIKQIKINKNNILSITILSTTVIHSKKVKPSLFKTFNRQNNQQIKQRFQSKQMKINFSELGFWEQRSSKNQQKQLVNSFKKALYQATPNYQTDRATLNEKKQTNTFKLLQTSVHDLLNTNQLLNKSLFATSNNPTSSRQPRINLSMTFPYASFSKSLSPSNIDQQIETLREKNILPDSALKFLKQQAAKSFTTTVQQDRNKNNHTKYKPSVRISTEENNHSRKGQNNEDQDRFSQIREWHDGEDDGQENQGYVPENTKILEQFLPKIYPGQSKTLKTQQTTGKLYLLNKKSQKKNNTYKQKQTIHSKPAQNLLSSVQRKAQKQLEQLQQKPSLNWTQRSKFTKKVENQRKKLNDTKNNLCCKSNVQKTQVFQMLYNDSYLRSCKRSLEKSQIQKQIKQKTKRVGENDHKICSYSKKFNNAVKGTFFERLQRSIQKKYNHEYLKKKYNMDAKTGHQFFKPNLKESQQTYQQLFMKSSKSNNMEKKEYNLKGNKQKQTVSKKTLVANQKIKVKAKATRPSTQIHSLSLLNKSCQFSPSKSLQKSEEHLNNTIHYFKSNKTNELNQSKQERLINKIVDVFYNKNSEKPLFSLSQHSKNNEEGFQKTYSALSNFTQQQYHILEPFFQQIETIQENSPVGRLHFKNLLLRFYKSLNLYDQLILRQPREKEEKMLKPNDSTYKTSYLSLSYEKQFIDSLSKSRLKAQEEQLNRKLCSHHPVINLVSRSLEKLGKTYNEKLYYV